MMSKSNQKRWPSVLALLGIIGGLTLVTDDGLVRVASAQDDLLAYVPVASPCRVLRTQGTAQTHLIAGASRSFFSFGSAGTIGAQGGNAAGCDHPRSAEGIQPVAIAANITAVGKQATGNGNIVAYPAGSVAPNASTVNYTTAANIANATLITLRTTDGSFTLLSSFANVPAIVDVAGYYYPVDAAQQVTVNCPTESIQAAIDAASPGGLLTITITGVCTENVTIKRDDVTLQGNPALGTDGVTAATVDGSAIMFFGAARGLVKDLTVTGGATDGYGILVSVNSFAQIVNVTAFGAGEAGISVEVSSAAQIVGGTIGGPGLGEGNLGGVAILDGSVAEILNTTITNNEVGIEVENASSAFIGDEAGVSIDVQINNNSRTGIDVIASVAEINNTNIANNGQFNAIFLENARFIIGNNNVVSHPDNDPGGTNYAIFMRDSMLTQFFSGTSSTITGPNSSLDSAIGSFGHSNIQLSNVAVVGQAGTGIELNSFGIANLSALTTVNGLTAGVSCFGFFEYVDNTGGGVSTVIGCP